MPKVGKLSLRIGNKHPQDYPLYYTQKQGFEIRGIDEEFFNITKISNCGYSTESELSKALYEAIPVYHKSKEKQRLVIGYKASGSAALRMIEVHKGSYRGILPGISRKIVDFDGRTTPYCSLGFEYDIYMEVFDGKKNDYYPVDSEHKISRVNPVHYTAIHNRVFIEYSDENFKFFENIKKGMQDLLKKMSLFFDLNSEESQIFISDNTKFLGDGN